ncbi:hypothetical protein IQ288_05105 [Burkholderia sp. R-69980]|uniref:hypothetical protein n=1 Tax=Paraburkholderia domus TaxID=2793075 RepID=UPI001912BB98|nr:hypothetical protein [Paraburkholderia domus]MBK5119253.1 hypothetical protein [Burkholderia sp. R-69980]CAE6864526.1 hypothetical protein R75471_00414 [Paraburkholderia domus]
MATKVQWSESFAFSSAPKDAEERAWQARFINEVEGESARGAVLTIVSFIDELLIDILNSYFPNKSHSERLLCELDGCLSTIMHRANIAFALSLLREREFKAIKALARIRNEFAHKWDGTSFDNKVISKFVNSFPAEYFEGIEGSNRAKFNCVASDTVQQLLARSSYAEDICHYLPKEYKDIFDRPIEERRRLLEARRKK